MPSRGVKKGSKRERQYEHKRQYEHIKASERSSGASLKRAEEIAARTVNKERARSGVSRASSRTSTSDISSGRRGGHRSGKSPTAAAHLPARARSRKLLSWSVAPSVGGVPT